MRQSGLCQASSKPRPDTENSARLIFRLLTGRPLAPPPELLRAVVDIGAANPLLFSGKKNGLAAVPTGGGGVKMHLQATKCHLLLNSRIAFLPQGRSRSAAAPCRPGEYTRMTAATSETPLHPQEIRITEAGGSICCQTNKIVLLGKNGPSQ